MNTVLEKKIERKQVINEASMVSESATKNNVKLELIAIVVLTRFVWVNSTFS